MTKKPEGELPETGKPEVKPYNNRAAIAARYPSLIISGVLSPDGNFRPGHLDYVVTQYHNNPDEADRNFADDLAYIREAMPEELN